MVYIIVFPFITELTEEIVFTTGRNAAILLIIIINNLDLKNLGWLDLTSI